MKFTNCASDGRTDSNSTDLVDIFLVHRPHAAPPVVGVGVDDVGGNVAAEVLYDAAVARPVAEVRREEVPEVMWCDVLFGTAAGAVPAHLPGVGFDNVMDHVRGEPLAPAIGRAHEQWISL